MRPPIWIVLITTLLALMLVLAVGRLLIAPPQALIVRAAASLEVITPNADGVEDVTEFTYTLSRNAFVSLVFEGTGGQVYVFREDEPRMAEDYRVGFGGVVDGYTLPGEVIGGQVIRRLMPDGEYTWWLRARAQDDGEIMEVSGSLTVRDADTPLPEIVEFTVFPNVFTPNQDGVDDRTQVNVGLAKAAQLDVFLVSETGTRLPLARREAGRQVGEAGRQTYDYEGGVDIGADPPPDGTYTVVAVAQDDEGQIIERTTTLTLLEGGKPRAEIVPQQVGPAVVFDAISYDEAYLTTVDSPGRLLDVPETPESLSVTAITMPVGDVLTFRLTVENYGPTPIRTSGPPPGTVYQQDQLPPALGYYQSSGTWRIGIQCETSTEPYPWRWAIGSADTLEAREAEDGEIFYYLLPGQRSTVWGGIRLTEITDLQNPQYCWAGLIHEDVEITLQNMNVGPREVELVEPGS